MSHDDEPLTPAERATLQAELDALLQEELEVAANLAQALTEQAEWRAFEARFKAMAREQGRELALQALPFLLAALKAAV